MKALTLWRPWSDAIVRGPKRVENRSWPPPSTLLGQVIALHAGRRYEPGDWPMPDFVPPAKKDSPEGIVGVARLTGYLDRRGDKRRSESALILTHPDYGEMASRLHFLDQDPWWAGPVGWLLEEVIAIEPVPCRGAMGLWTVPADVEAFVRQRVEEARRA